jgi:pSer/pThr/pTyr-binding forkhead associated (FHA) protein
MAKSSKSSYYLVVLGARSRKKSVRLRREVIAGRSADCDLVLEHRSISREHARFFLQNGRCFVEDLNSHNGIRVNDEKASYAQLEPGDTVDFGPYQVVLRGGPGSSSGLLGWLLSLFR